MHEQSLYQVNNKQVRFQASGPTKVRRPTPSQCSAKFPASALRQRGPGEGEGGALESNLHHQCE